LTVSVCGPTLCGVVGENCALPPESATIVGLPSYVNVTEPSGVPPPGAFAVTLAVNVIACPNTDGLADDPIVVVVSALITVWLTGAAVVLLPNQLAFSS